MNYLLKIICLSLLVSLIYSVLSCDSEDDPKDVEVNIVRTFTTTLRTGEDSFGIARNDRQANVRYTVENTGANTVHGWKIFFYVSVENGPQLDAKGSAAYTLEPGEKSSEKIASGRIPAGSGNTTGATLNHIEAN